MRSRAIDLLSRVRTGAQRLPGGWRAPVGVVAVVVVAAATGLLGGILDRAPGPLRDLPGVRALVEVEPPAYERSMFGLHSPLSVATTRDGQLLYVVEGTGDRTVRKLNARDGEVLGELVPPLTEPGTRKPLSVAVGADGLVYVVDRVRRTVDIFDSEDRWLGALPPPVADFEWAPLAVDTDAQGTIYVTNTHEASPVLSIYDSEGDLVTTFDTIEAGGVAVSFPNAVSVDRSGRLVIGDSNNSRLVVLDVGTGETAVFGTQPTETLALPRGVVLDQNGLTLVVDANDHTFSGWDFTQVPQSRVFIVGSPGIEDGAFLFPNDIAIDESGRIYVADRDNDRVQVWGY